MKHPQQIKSRAQSRESRIRRDQAPGAALQFRLLLNGRRARAAVLREDPQVDNSGWPEEIDCNLCGVRLEPWDPAIIVCKSCWVKIDDYIACHEWERAGFQLRFFLTSRAPVFVPWEAPPARRRDFLFLVPERKPNREVEREFAKIKLPPMEREPRWVRCEWCTVSFEEYSPRANCCKSCFLWLEGIAARCAA